MRAVMITKPGDVDVLEVADRPTREPGDGEVRIAVKAAAVNPTDITFRKHGAGPDLPPPWTPGMDAAGEVESVGAGVDRLRVGEQVMVAVNPFRPEGGAQQELLVVPTASVVAIPDGATLAQASTLPMNGLTAMGGLEMLGLHEGDTLAVAGGGGLLGSYVIGVASMRGIRVIADAKPEDQELVKSFGADVVVPRGASFGDAIRAVAPGGADAVYDTALLYRDAFPAIRDGGGLLVVRGWDADNTITPLHEVEERGIRVHPHVITPELQRTNLLEALRRLGSSGRLKLRVARELPPEEAAEAHRLMEAGGLRGRAVIVF
ncbi:MAG TPA: NADP-dependent oxidoreductase [Acidimicrobiales bacterium]|nr:NADP-dependent oxidoreductase [Acidimicrobiales bacterium]